jgi:FemAB-related protein (PEP-CTERM system-associated)
MFIEKLSIENESLWDSYVDHHPEATFFHRIGWKKLIEQSMGYSGNYIMARDNDEVVGIYPLFILTTGLFGTMGISLPYVHYGGIVANNLETEKMLIDKASAFCREKGCRYIELRQRFPLKTKLPVSDRKVLSIIPLQGGHEHVFGILHQNVRNKIRKAKKNGVLVQNGIEYLSEFYDIYARNLRDMGTPVITRRFFECIVNTFPQHVRIYRATRQGKAIGAKIVLIDKNTCYFVGVAAARDNLCYAPVHAMNWAAIQDACMVGCKQVDFGRSTANSTHYVFKKYWGSNTLILPWTYQLLNCDEVPELNKENPRFTLAMALWKKLPVSLTRLIGPPIARRLP